MSKRPYLSDDVRLEDGLDQPGKRLQTQDLRDDQFADADFAALRGFGDDAGGIMDELQRLIRCSNSIPQSRNRGTEMLSFRRDVAKLSHRLEAHVSQEGSMPVSSSTPKSVPSKSGVPSMLYATPWRSSEISQQLPPLPAIRDKKLEELAFIHPGRNPTGNPNGQYEKLEWLGDAMLEAIATTLIDSTFLLLPSGRCSQIRERLIRNTTLAAYFREYGLESRARLPKELAESKQLGRGSSADKDLLKTQSDMFEAYVAAVILDDAENGLETAVNWLKALWGRSIEADVKRAERGNDAETSKSSPKEQLRAKIVVPGVKIRYETTSSRDKKDKHLNQQLFGVAAYLDGWGETNKFLAVGSGFSVKEAGQRAAEEVLRNRKLLNTLEAKKKAFLDEAKEAVVL